MNTRSKLLQLTEDLTLPPAAQAPTSTRAPSAISPPAASFNSPLPPAAPGLTPRTGPGQMLEVRSKILGLEGDLAKANERVQELEKVPQTIKLDASQILPTGWANRHPDAFKSAEFERLKADIALSEGNVQAIKVRALAGETGKYEIVFGHRRHRACLELGLPVLATIDTAPISDAELFAQMDRENRERADLSPYEQGAMYRKALDSGLYPSNRRLAEALGVSHTWVANVLAVADLPASVVECFKSPLEVQHRHAKAIEDALKHDRKGVLRRADKLRQGTRQLAAGAVVASLVAADSSSSKTLPAVLMAGERKVGTWSREADGRLSIQLDAGLSDEKVTSILAVLASTLAQVD